MNLFEYSSMNKNTLEYYNVKLLRHLCGKKAGSHVDALVLNPETGRLKPTVVLVEPNNSRLLFFTKATTVSIVVLGFLSFVNILKASLECFGSDT